MITYLGMTAPIALAAAISWFRHPYKEGENEVKVAHVGAKKWAVLIILTAAVTAAFYFILKYFNTAKLAISTVSVATSFIAALWARLRRKRYCINYYVDNGDCRRPVVSADDSLLLGVLCQ